MDQIQSSSINEQMETAIDNLAQTIAYYNKSLLEAGVPEATACELTLQFADEFLELTLFSRMRAAAEGEAKGQ